MKIALLSLLGATSAINMQQKPAHVYNMPSLAQTRCKQHAQIRSKQHTQEEWNEDVGEDGLMDLTEFYEYLGVDEANLTQDDRDFFKLEMFDEVDKDKDGFISY